MTDDLELRLRRLLTEWYSGYHEHLRECRENADYPHETAYEVDGLSMILELDKAISG